jgi:galactokinase/mevalonate kinase-like predicted kinase
MKDLKKAKAWYTTEAGYNLSKIMQQAHKLASCAWGNYRRALGKALKTQWEIARSHRQTVENAHRADRFKAVRKAQDEADAKAAKAQAEGSKKRMLVLHWRRDEYKQLIPQGGAFDGFGRTFRADNEIASTHGHEWLGHEGQKVCYMYYYA